MSAKVEPDWRRLDALLQFKATLKCSNKENTLIKSEKIYANQARIKAIFKYS